MSISISNKSPDASYQKTPKVKPAIKRVKHAEVVKNKKSKGLKLNGSSGRKKSLNKGSSKVNSSFGKLPKKLNKSGLLVSSDNQLNEKIRKLKVDLHEERRINGELWFSYRKYETQIADSNQEYQKLKKQFDRKKATQEIIENSVKKDNEELNKLKNQSNDLKEETYKLLRKKVETEEKLKKALKSNNIYQLMLKKLLDEPQTKTKVKSIIEDLQFEVHK